MKKPNKLEKALLKVAQSHQATYHQLQNAMKTVRAELAKEYFYQKPKSSRTIPIMPNEDQLRAFFKAFDRERDPQYKLWARLIFDCQVRVHELVGILVKEVNLLDHKILIHGKGAKDRVVLVSPEISELLRFHISSHPDYLFLFENKDHKPYSTRMVQMVFQRCKQRAGIEFRLSPHIGRHVGLTHLTRQAFVPIMEQSGHASKESLSLYQHLSADQFQPEFNQAMQSFWNKIL